jgi:hypothetical protein
MNFGRWIKLGSIVKFAQAGQGVFIPLSGRESSLGESHYR